MKRRIKLSVGKKLYMGFIFMMLLVLGVGSLGMKEMSSIYQEAEEINGNWLPGVSIINNVNYLTERVLSLELKYVVTQDQSQRDKLLAEMDQTLGKVETALSRYQAKIVLDEERKAFTSLQETWAQYLELHQQMIDVGKQGESFAMDLLLLDADTIYSEMQGYIDTLIKLNNDGANQAIKEADAAYQRANNLTGWLLGISVLFGMVYAYRLTRSITVPLKQISDNMKQVGQGDLRVEDVACKNRDEIGSLAADCNNMVRDLREVIGQVGTSAVNLSASSEQLAASADQTADATQQIASTIQEVASGADSQQQSAEESARSMEEMVTGIQRIAESAAAASELSAQTSDEAARGDETIQQAVRNMESIRHSVGRSTEVIRQLEERSREIGEIIAVITGIAGQTNLLALNAAIEAARAGEQGRGFAVVADEVRKLAEQSEASAQHIAQLIEQIQSDTHLSVESMTTANRDVSEGMTTVRDAGEAFERIVQAVTRTTDQIQEVSAASEQLSASAQQVTGTVELMAMIARESTSHIQGVAGLSEEQLASMEEISSSTANLSKMAQELQELTQRFRL
ncbi:methyl-accepting chemotaxis protein [Brevibacillus humidisoli]|uniref:methyl-accepting chemotaxis protein n=1 Tax=Brevibacillus humidisoli TaxID=2895522 RepID=UPI001E484F21|nr:methyl-accepting chemotaxis protein [Brevibacillus humidisoli]UFJ39359.1 methyl-accepting chemotaxis protein [Brevibacillus humidisoli]